jgi:hypothetical protein
VTDTKLTPGQVVLITLVVGGFPIGMVLVWVVWMVTK